MLARAATALLLIGSHQATAADDDTGWFVGISVNRLDADFEDRDDKNFDDTDDALGLKAGYMFNNYSGLELSYSDLGNEQGGVVI